MPVSQELKGIKMRYLILMLLLVTNTYANPFGVHLRSYGATLNGSGIGDSTALQNAINDINNGVVKTNHIYFDGNLTLTTPPPMFDRIYLHGDNIYGSIISKKYYGGYYLRWEGRPGYSGGGLYNVGIPTDQYSPNSYMIMLRATSSGYAPDGFEMENVYLASGVASNAPFRVIEIYGLPRTSPIGIRQVRFKNVTCFGATGGCSVYIDGAVDFLSWGFRTYPGLAPYGNILMGSNNINCVVQ
jgi:hypothetical protein